MRPGYEAESYKEDRMTTAHTVQVALLAAFHLWFAWHVCKEVRGELRELRRKAKRRAHDEGK
jgi:hypothetical protein